jgi:nucleoside-triphosphatase
VDLLEKAGLRVRGFLTEEMREGGRRVGFAVEAVHGRREVLAATGLASDVRVGRYGVDVQAFERIALPSLHAPRGDVVVIDELGKMELASDAFVDAVEGLFDEPVAIVATVHAFRHPFTDALKARSDVEVMRVTARGRDDLPRLLAERLGASR